MSSSSSPGSGSASSPIRSLSLTESDRATLPGICPEWSANIKSVLFSESDIQSKVRELAAQISKDYAGKKILAVGLLTGAFVFVSDLLRHFTVPYDVDFMVVSSYGHGTTS